MSAKSYTRSFAGGEIAPLLFGRLDLAKFQTGLSQCLNWVVTPQGPIENRAGFEYVLKTGLSSPTVLIPFTYNTEQSYALEVGQGYMRFHTQGGTLLEASQFITGITQAAAGVFTIAGHGYVAGDWVFLDGINGPSALNGRWGIVTSATADTFILSDLWGSPISTASLPAWVSGGIAARVYTLASPFNAADVFELHYVQSADVMTITHPNYAPYELRRLGATNWTLTLIDFDPTIATPGAPTCTPAGPGGGTAVLHEYCTTAVAAGTLEESFQSTTGGATIDLSVAGNTVAVQSAAVANAVRYNVFKAKNGLFGYIGQADAITRTLTDNNIEPDMSKTPPQASTPFGADWPRAVSYFEQRRCFGGTPGLPQNLWLTRSGTESNLTYSIPGQDDDGITARIVAREANTVRHLVPLNDLLALTSGGVWRISSGSGDALTPSNLSVKPQGYVGASMVTPVVTSSSVLYAPDRGSHIREITYRWETQTYQSDDLAVLAPHLFDFKNVTQLAYAKTPYQVLWAVRDDGTLLGLTHQPEHEVKAWHQHTTDGLFKSVCVIPEGDEDAVYVIVQRTINAQTVQYIERMHSRQISAIEDAFFVDAGATYDGSAATTISGLHHLEGEEVTILADGGVEPVQTVTGGAITLSAAASVVHIGLPYDCDATTMPLSMEAAAFGQGANKNVGKVTLRLYQSGAGIQAGPAFDKLREYRHRSVDDYYGSPPALRTANAEISVDPKWQQDGLICIRQSNPLPVTILSMTTETTAGG
jgi:hypothetical protein